jgi:hypothetical protein
MESVDAYRKTTSHQSSCGTIRTYAHMKPFQHLCLLFQYFEYTIEHN